MKYEHNKTSDKTEVVSEKEKEYILLKWGTLKGWNFTSEKSKKLFKEYCEIGASYSAMAQKDTPRQKEIICELIDCCNGRIQNDCDGTVYKDKKEAKKYVMEYNKGEKIDKPKHIVEIPNVGDTKQKIKFSFFPTRIDDKTIIWIEKYINIYEYVVVEERTFYKMVNVTRPIYGWKLKERKFYS